MGVPLEFVGPAVDPRTLVLLDWPEPQVYDGLLRSSIIYLDTFGNVKLSALGGHMLNAFGGLREGEWLYLRIEDDTYSRDLRVPWVGMFGHVPVGQVLFYEDSYGRLCLAVNQGSAVATLGLRQDMSVTITRSPLPGTAAARETATVPLEARPAPTVVRALEPEPEPAPARPAEVGAVPGEPVPAAEPEAAASRARPPSPRPVRRARADRRAGGGRRALGPSRSRRPSPSRPPSPSAVDARAPEAVPPSPDARRPSRRAWRPVGA